MIGHLVTAFVLAMIALPGIAQETLVRGPERLGQGRKDGMAVPNKNIPIFLLDRKLPPVVPDQQRLSHQIKVFIKKIQLSGNTIFTTEELSGVTGPYQGRFVNTEELQELRRLLTRYYVQRGYINSGAVLPDQNVTDGIIRFQIVEGKLTNVVVSGNSLLRNAYIESRLLSPTDEALQIEDMQQRLQMLQQSNLINRISGELYPGQNPGEASLKVMVEEAFPWHLAFSFSNNRPASVGSEQGEIFAGHDNLTGWGDSIRFRLGFSEGSDGGGIYYQMPLSARETRLILSADKSNSSVVEQPFASLDIDSELEAYRIGFTHPLLRTPWREFSVGLFLDRRHSLTKLAGSPFSFSQGVQEGESDVTVIRLTQDWFHRDREQAIVAKSTFSFGIDALNVTTNETGPDGRFSAWLGQFQWLKRFGQDDHQSIFRADLQLTEDPLLPLEQCAIGGAQTVRGYRVNQLVRDNCLVASMEYRLPLMRLTLPYLSEGPNDGVLELAAFADYGKAWNEGRSSSDAEEISSVGLGLRWNAGAGFFAELYWGYAFQNFDYEDHDLQDDGVSFRVYWEPF
jgi:hemolysin activation/secretion protein